MSRSYPTLRFRFFAESDLDLVAGGIAPMVHTTSDIVPAEPRPAREANERQTREEEDELRWQALARTDRTSSIEGILAYRPFSEEDTTAALLSVAFETSYDDEDENAA